MRVVMLLDDTFFDAFSFCFYLHFSVIWAFTFVLFSFPAQTVLHTNKIKQSSNDSNTKGHQRAPITCLSVPWQLIYQFLNF